MSIGHGKYGPIATELLERFKAKGVIIAILDGEHGTGIELAGPALVHAATPDFLEAIAKDIRRNAQADASAVSAGETHAPRNAGHS